MSYVDAIKDGDKIKVVERVDGKRIYKEYPIDYSFYYENSAGTYKSIFGTSLLKVEPKSYEEFNKLKRAYSHKKLFEADVNPIFRAIEQHYKGVPAPNFNVAFFDIETAFDKELGYSSAQDAFNPITSISVYLQWLDQMVCLAIPPKTLKWNEAQEIADKVGNVILFQSEIEMLETFITLIEDADVISGWNSEMYDVPYIVGRIHRLMGKHEARALCLWNQSPKKKKIIFGGKEETSYELVGRLHLDYLVLYKKYNYEERQSYALNSIAEIELEDKKVEYSGTLDQLYHNDFQLFLEYNIKDTMLLDKLDKKLDFIALANVIAHDSLTPVPTVMGTVSMVDQAITVEAHESNMIVPNRKSNFEYEDVWSFSDEDSDDEDGTMAAAGGWVYCRSPGMVEWIGVTDLNSLYPSMIRALNMSPETIVGQVRTTTTEKALMEFIHADKKNSFSLWWNNRFSTLEMENFFNNDNSELIWVDFEDGKSMQVTGAELRKFIFDDSQNLCISANGTIFRKDFEGTIPRLLSRWYSERKQMQGFTKQFIQIQTGVGVESNIEYVSTTELTLDKAINFRLELLELDDIKSVLDEYGLKIVNKTVLPNDKNIQVYRTAEGYWDRRQLCRKIRLNSLYGGLLNEHMKFYDQRIGQSTTLTGRQITRHMASKTNEIITGEYTWDSECILYCDTDSTFFTAWPMVKDDVLAGKLIWNKDAVVELYDQIATAVSDTFPDFAKKQFNIDKKQGSVLKAGREIVGQSGMFVKRKRYAIWYYDKEGKRLDTDGKTGKIKVTGLDLKRSDTPKYMQKFLEELLTDALKGAEEKDCLEKITKFKEQFKEMKPWLRGSPKSVNNLSSYIIAEEDTMRKRMNGEKVSFSMPGHVRGASNWNTLRERNHDLNTSKIVDGQKIVVCPLKQNDFGFTSIAYPVDETRLPEWFTNLPFDEDKMMESIVDKKIKNVIGVLKWDFDSTRPEEIHFSTLFEF